MSRGPRWYAPAALVLAACVPALLATSSSAAAASPVLSPPFSLEAR